jgi:hypothetical protein
MALIRNILFLTFEEIDTFNEKKAMRSLFESKGYHLIAETKIDSTGIVKEWIFESPITYGKFNMNTVPASEQDQKKIFMFNPKGVDG